MCTEGYACKKLGIPFVIDYTSDIKPAFVTVHTRGGVGFKPAHHFHDVFDVLDHADPAVAATKTFKS
eukprot:9806979-Alexandrium_andersonii.AAC.1